MRRHLPTRTLACAAVAGTASFAAVAIPGSIATATVKSVSYTTLSGSETSQTVSGCSGSDSAQTGVSGKQVPDISKKTAVVTWKTGKTTDYKYTYTLKSGSANTCPAKAKYTKLDLVTETGTITGGTATLMKSGPYSGKTCAYELTAKPHTVAVVGDGPTKY